MYAASIAVCATGDVYVTAGDAPDDKTLHNVYHYSVNTDHWTMLSQPGHHSGVLHMLNDRLTIFGGSDPVTCKYHNKVTTYNNDTNKWYSHYPDMLSKRFKPGVITYHNYVIVFGGGSSPHTIHDSIEVMEYHDELQWKEISVHLPVPMWGIIPNISGNNIIIVGYSTVGGLYNKYYQITTDEIISSFDQLLSNVAVSIDWNKRSPPTHGRTATVPYSNPPVMVGGGDQVGTIPTSDIMLYDASKKSWRKVDSLTSARQYVGVALLNISTIIVIGGNIDGSSVEAAKVSSVNIVQIGNIVPNHQYVIA